MVCYRLFENGPGDWLFSCLVLSGLNFGDMKERHKNDSYKRPSVLKRLLF